MTLFEKDATLKFKIVKFVNVTSFFAFSKLITIFRYCLFYANIKLIIICLRRLSLVANFLDNYSIE